MKQQPPRLTDGGPGNKRPRFELPAAEMNPPATPKITPKASTIGSDNPRKEGVRNGTH